MRRPYTEAKGRILKPIPDESGPGAVPTDRMCSVSARSADIERHYRYLRRWRAPDPGHMGETGAPGARPDRLTRTRAVTALAHARDRVRARDVFVMSGNLGVAADYDATPGFGGVP